MLPVVLADTSGFGTPSPSWNLISDVHDLLSFAFMRNAFEAGTASAIVAGIVGYFVVLRGTSFAAHAVAHIGFAGASGAVLLGINPVFGLGAFALGSSAGMGLLGKRLHGRDTVIGLVMALSLGLGSLFISLYKGNAANAYSILFGQIFGISTTAMQVTVGTGAATLLILALIYRPLLFSSLDEEVAEARGVRVGALGIGFMLLMALAVSEAVQVSGVLLIFALLIAPAAIVERLIHRPFRAMTAAAVIAVAITWSSLALAYYTPYPVSFYVTSIAFGLYLIARGIAALRTRSRGLRLAAGADRPADQRSRTPERAVSGSHAMTAPADSR